MARNQVEVKNRGQNMAEDLCILISCIIHYEQELEKQRINICENEKFFPQQSFETIIQDHPLYPYIQKNTLKKFLGQHRQALSDKGAWIFISQYAENPDQGIAINEFLEMVLPQSNQDLRDRALSRQNLRQQEFYYITEQLAKLIIFEYKFLNELEARKSAFMTKYNWDLLSAYKIFDPQDSGSIGYQQFKSVMVSNNFIFSQDMYFAFLRRTNKDDNQVITKDEFFDSSFLIPHQNQNLAPLAETNRVALQYQQVYIEKRREQQKLQQQNYAKQQQQLQQQQQQQNSYELPQEGVKDIKYNPKNYSKHPVNASRSSLSGQQQYEYYMQQQQQERIKHQQYNEQIKQNFKESNFSNQQQQQQRNYPKHHLTNENNNNMISHNIHNQINNQNNSNNNSRNYNEQKQSFPPLVMDMQTLQEQSDIQTFASKSTPENQNQNQNQQQHQQHQSQLKQPSSQIDSNFNSINDKYIYKY